MAPMKPLLLAAAVLFFFAPSLRADEVVLKGGTRLPGVLLGRDDAALRLLTPAGEELRLAAGDVQEVVADADAPSAKKVTRWHKIGQSGGQLQTALVHLLPAQGEGPRIDLVGAVHIADGAYYRDVQRMLEQADVVLYEAVKSKEDGPPEPSEEGEEGKSAIRGLQMKLARGLGLQFQIDAINYRRPHFVHADLTVEELDGGPEEDEGGGDEPGKAGEEGTKPRRRGGLPKELQGLEALVKLAEPLFAGIDKPAETPEARKKVRARKKMFGQMLGNATAFLPLLFGKKLNDLLIVRRNAVVLKRLKEVPAGTRTVAVFYGAGHLPDLERRIVEDLGYRRAGARWLTSWDVPDEK